MPALDALANLEDALEQGAYWLESSRGGLFARYCLGPDDQGDGLSAWYCSDCGLQIDDPADGCEHCGIGTEALLLEFDA